MSHNMSFCTFCLEDGGDEGCKIVDNLEVLRFLCQEFHIDFDKIGLSEDEEDPLECHKVNSSSLGIPLCTDCDKQFGQIGRIQLVLKDVRGHLDKLLTIVRSNVIVSSHGKERQMGQEVIDSGVSRKCEILRNEIILSTVGKGTCTSEEVRREEHCQMDAADLVDVKLEEIEEVQVKVEEGDDYMEENVETFNNQTSEPATGNIIFPPKIVSLWIVQPNATNINTVLPNTSKTVQLEPPGPHSLVQPNDRRERHIKIKCELCTTTKKICNGVPSFIVHVRDFHKSAEMKYSCSKPNCDKKFPVELLLKRHLQFHDEQVTKPYGAFNCTECEIWIRCHKSYKKHLEWHKLTKGRCEKALRCRFCTMTSVYPLNVRNHEVTKHPEELRHTCDTCNEKYSSASILDTHVKSHATEGPYACLICEVTCEKGSELEEHIIQSHVPMPSVYKKYNFSSTTCPTCERYFKTLPELKHHFKTIHQKYSYSCELCPESHFTSRSTLVGHVLKYHETGEKSLSCSHCPMQFTTNFMLIRHTECHNDAKNRLWCQTCWMRFALDDQAGFQKHMLHAHDKEHKEQEHRTKKAQIHPCTGMDCGKSFVSPIYLRKHELLYHPEVFNFSCKLCENVYSREVHLETHMNTHADAGTGPFGCTICKTHQFSTAKGLAVHLTKHTGEAKIPCTKCTATFYSEHDLRTHMIRQHRAKNMINCEVCGKQFITRASFIRHKRIQHADPATLPKSEPKTCKECGQQFPTAALRSAHIKKQHKPLVARVCEICGKAVKSILNHMRTHAGDKRHACYFCDKRFVRYEALKSHVFTHTGEKPFICHICPSEFNQMHCLKSHMNIHKKNGTYFPKPNSNISQNVNLESADSSISNEYVSTGMEVSSSVFSNLRSLDFE